jgi:hypothetical protein
VLARGGPGLRLPKATDFELPVIRQY